MKKFSRLRQIFRTAISLRFPFHFSLPFRLPLLLPFRLQLYLCLQSELASTVLTLAGVFLASALIVGGTTPAGAGVEEMRSEAASAAASPTAVPNDRVRTGASSSSSSSSSVSSAQSRPATRSAGSPSGKSVNSPKAPSTSPANSAKIEESCECPKLACDPCSFEQGVTFYTSKCGERGARLRSCGRPTCIPVEQATAECPAPPAAGSAPREPVVVEPAGGSPSVADATKDIRIVGSVKVMRGSVSITHADGKKSQVIGDGKVLETDTIESSKGSTALVSFEGGNRLHVHPDTVVQVREFRDPDEPSSRRQLLQLIKGKIRNQVEQKYNGKTSYYRVYTTGAVAGVRGTDFVMEHHEGKQLETKAETLNGHVFLSTLDESDTRDVQKGETSSFIAELPDSSYAGKDFTSFVKRGKLSPVQRIGKERLHELDLESRVDRVALSSLKPEAPEKETEICQKPKGFFNQCAWKCAGNPPGEKTCRLDLPKVTCVRTRCNANGEWADETVIPTKAASELCPATGYAVKNCDY